MRLNAIFALMQLIILAIQPSGICSIGNWIDELVAIFPRDCLQVQKCDTKIKTINLVTKKK